MKSLLVRLEIGSGFCGFVDTNDGGGDDDDDDDDGDDEDVWYWLGKSDVDTSICEDGELVLELSLIILSKDVSFELIEYWISWITININILWSMSSIFAKFICLFW